MSDITAAIAEVKERDLARVRRQAALKIIATLRSPMAIMSKPHREDMIRLAQEHGLSAAEILEVAVAWTLENA